MPARFSCKFDGILKLKLAHAGLKYHVSGEG